MATPHFVLSDGSTVSVLTTALNNKQVEWHAGESLANRTAIEFNILRRLVYSTQIDPVIRLVIRRYLQALSMSARSVLLTTALKNEYDAILACFQDFSHEHHARRNRPLLVTFIFSCPEQLSPVRQLHSAVVPTRYAAAFSFSRMLLLPLHLLCA